MKKYFKLSNKYCFVTLLILLIAILTGINNYYFYEHAKRSAARNVSQLETQVNKYRDYCIENKITSEQCHIGILVLTKAFSEKAYYNDTIVVKDSDKNILWEKPIRHWDKVVKSDIEIILPNNIINEENKIFKSVTFNNEMVLTSIVRSMTFSIAEFVSDVKYKEIAEENGVFNLVDNNRDQDNVIYTLNNKEFTLNKHHDFKFKNGDTIKQGDVIASGNLFVALDQFVNIYFFRSRPTIGFMIFSFLILYIYRKRELIINDEQNIADQQIIKIVDRKSNIDFTDVCDKLRKYDNIINPPVNTLNADTLFDGDIDEVGTKFRKVAEKIVFEVYEDKIGARDFRLDLNEAIYQLNKNGTISDAAKNYLSIVRVYGNLSSHYSKKTISRNEAITVASALINVIDEIVEKNLLREHDQSLVNQMDIENTKADLTNSNHLAHAKGLRIVKKVSDSI